MMIITFTQNATAWLKMPVAVKHRFSSFVDWKAFSFQIFSVPTLAVQRQGALISSFVIHHDQFKFEDQPIELDSDTCNFPLLFDKPGFFEFLCSLLHPEILSTATYTGVISTLTLQPGIDAPKIMDLLLDRGLSEVEIVRILFDHEPFPNLNKEPPLPVAPETLALQEWRRLPMKQLSLFLENIFSFDVLRFAANHEIVDDSKEPDGSLCVAPHTALDR